MFHGLHTDEDDKANESSHTNGFKSGVAANSITIVLFVIFCLLVAAFVFFILRAGVPLSWLSWLF